MSEVEYKQCTGHGGTCGADCGMIRHAPPDEPCWGQVIALEDYPNIWVHSCEGHRIEEDGYTPAPVMPQA